MPFSMQHYRLGLNNVVELFPVESMADLLAWAEDTFGPNANRQVALTDFSPGVCVSTVFLGLDHNWGSGPPLVFETMVFDDYGAGECYRWSTWDEAEQGHKDAVAELEAKLKAKPLTPELKEQLARLKAMPDSEIDCSDIPEQRDWSGATRGRFNRGGPAT